ncbi:hypothetical protein C8J57DRAFT_1240629 [Mycena rebaudengoi]|nr:hypothetical protein C8J57DRAFT_1240629 [Mycena rebaudengoi]
MHKVPKARKWAPCSKRAATSRAAPIISACTGRQKRKNAKMRKCAVRSARATTNECNIGCIPQTILGVLRLLLARAHGATCAKMRKCANVRCAAHVQLQVGMHIPRNILGAPHPLLVHAQGAECAQMRAAPRACSRKWALHAQCAEPQMRAAQRARSRSACAMRRHRANARRTARTQLQAHPPKYYGTAAPIINAFTSRQKRANAHHATRAQLQAGTACARRRNRENARHVVRAQPQVGVIKRGRGKGNGGGGTSDGLMGW